MKKLERGSEPENLIQIKNNKQIESWEQLPHESKVIIKNNLIKMQKGQYCAYCERFIDKIEKTHIEHFKPKKNNRNVCFDWNNLFLSCCNDNTCGIYKDSPKNKLYNQIKLIKPDRDDPKFFFEYNSFTGYIEPKKNINKTEREKAEETIRVFNLNEQKLKSSRKRIIDSYLPSKEDMQIGSSNGCTIDDMYKIVEQENISFKSIILNLLF